uniref:BHLH domain-containing protein n=1 Tax=Biomphalaria glabrata TaxID=6526 RepID=A0A2C9LLM8_BIOGL
MASSEYSTNVFDSGFEGTSVDAEEETPAARANRLRIIAKQRRDTENSILTELIDLLPLDKKVLAKKDKSSLLRLVLSYMRFRAAFDAGEFRITHHLRSVCLRSIFVFCLAPKMVGLQQTGHYNDFKRWSQKDFPPLDKKCKNVNEHYHDGA